MSDSSQIFFDRSPLGSLWEIIFAKTFVFPWLSGVPKQPFPCFVELLAFWAKAVFLGAFHLLPLILSLKCVLP